MSYSEIPPFLVPGRAECEVPLREADTPEMASLRSGLDNILLARNLMTIFAVADLIAFRGLDVAENAPTVVKAVGAAAFLISFWGAPIAHVTAAVRAGKIHAAEPGAGIDCGRVLGVDSFPDSTPPDQGQK